jgi:hypothetical protein
MSMFSKFAEWAWRLAILAAVLWVGWEVAQLREDLMDPGDEQTESASSGLAA